MEPSKYFLSQDGSSHWYVVPVDKARDWYEWCEIDEYDQRAWDAPDYAVQVGGCPAQVEFYLPAGSPFLKEGK